MTMTSDRSNIVRILCRQYTIRYVSKHSPSISFQ